MNFFSLCLEFCYKLVQVIRTKLLPRNFELKKDGYPYLSIETYFYRTNLKILNSSDLETFRFQDFKRDCNDKNIKVFLDTSLLDEFCKIMDKTQRKFQSIVIAHTDKTIELGMLSTLLNKFEKIFTVNFKGNSNEIIKLPVGLEQQSYRSGGQIKDFFKYYSAEPVKRKINFVIGWNDNTNLTRNDIRKSLKDLHQSLILNRRITPQMLHRFYRKSLFVISPPGNGPDSHRTWEAIYCGAVPVVLKSTFSGDFKWPIFFIEDWKDLLRLNRNELEKIYKSLALDRIQAIKFSKNILDGI